MSDLNTILRSIQSIARSAGALLREAYDQPREVGFKGEVNPVTHADLVSEAFIINALKEQFPGYAILAEEGGSAEGTNGLMWLIDPLDGTVNFAHGFPVFSVSIALRDDEGPLTGVVYDPLRDECFSASRGQGATLNNRPIHVSDTPRLIRALIATGFPYDQQTAEDNNSAALAAFLRRAQGIRRAGSAALDLSYVACGRLDAFWEMRLNPWDVAAGALIVREAGGTVTDYSGGNFSAAALSGRQIVASNGLIHAEMLSVLRDLYDFSQDGSLTLRSR